MHYTRLMPAAISKADLFARLAEGHAAAVTVVTPNRRLSQALMAEFRKASNDLQRTINTELALDEPVVPPALRPNRLLDSLVTLRTVPPAAPAPAPASLETVDEAVAPASNEPVEPQ